ncbi:MAG TPA: hypothetical protein ENH62_06290 [Marinobacter sp.]|uniref:Uncharacterized protein n=1 Tax=marine sediment metagenome TaxID=412755 RepID=A0A0F9PG14_9ZZZZ|nr:hypothetical protein [Marinobacter sp.]
MAFIMKTSIHGRRMGISSSGGFIAALDATGGGSTVFSQSAQMWGDALVETVSAAAATISNSGITIISSASTAGAAFVMSAPIAGIHKEIHFQTPSSLHSINTTAITIFFNSSLSDGSSGGSTILNFVSATTELGGVLVLRGLSDTNWGIVSHTVASSS